MRFWLLSTILLFLNCLAQYQQSLKSFNLINHSVFTTFNLYYEKNNLTRDDIASTDEGKSSESESGSETSDEKIVDFEDSIEYFSFISLSNFSSTLIEESAAKFLNYKSHYFFIYQSNHFRPPLFS